MGRFPKIPAKKEAASFPRFLEKRKISGRRILLLGPQEAKGCQGQIGRSPFGYQVIIVECGLRWDLLEQGRLTGNWQAHPYNL